MIRSLLRIGIAVFLAVAVGAAIIRQPTLTRLPFRGPRADPALLRRHVEFLTTTARPRGAAQPENLELAAAYIERAFRASGGRVESQHYEVGRRRYRNVLVHFGPRDGAPMIVGAHYDAFTMTGDLPGADDNASGAAGLIELARLLGRTPPDAPVTLVAFSTEEPPHFASENMGSAVHAWALGGGVGMICLEMIGYYAEKQTWPNRLFQWLYPDRGDFIAVGGRWPDRALTRHVKRAIRGAGGIDVYSFTGPAVTLDASDHRNYWAAGIPAVLVTDTAFLRNPHYHTTGDTADTLDYARMARVVDGIFTAVSITR